MDNGKAGAAHAAGGILKVYIDFNKLTGKLNMASNTHIPGHELLGILEYAKASVTRKEIMGEIAAVIASAMPPRVVDPKTGNPAAPPPETATPTGSA